MKIVFLCSGQYPYGNAATNRHLSYARGLVEIGHEVHFFLLSPQDPNFFNEKVKSFNGILLHNFFYSRNGQQFSVTKKLFSFFIFIQFIKKEMKQFHLNNKIDRLVFLDTNSFTIYSFAKFGKKLGIKVFHECTEYPFIVFGNSLRQKLNLWFYTKKAVNVFDGIFVITDALNSYFELITKSKIKIATINMTVEPDRFNNTCTTNEYQFEYIAYCGTIYGDKDGVPILIKAFSHIAAKWPEIKLVIIGDNTDSQKFQSIIDLVKLNRLGERIVFTGKVSRNQMPGLLQNSKLLLLARPANKQAEGGFPTKLGEYLATGKPVIITSVGEIPQFLKHQVNAYLAKPNDDLDFALKIDEALSNYDNALLIGQKGKELTENVFNYKFQAQRLANFLLEN